MGEGYSVFEGSVEAKILFISDFLRIQDKAENLILTAQRRDLLFNACKRAGLMSEEYALTVIHPTCPPGGKSIDKLEKALRTQDLVRCRELINASRATVLVPLGEHALEFICGLEGISKWHLSILTSKAELGGRIAVPLYHPEHVMRNFSDSAYISFGCTRIKEEALLPKEVPQRIFKLSPSIPETIKWLKDKALNASELSFDIETGRGIINTMGFALRLGQDSFEAIAIEALPEGKTPEEYYELWRTIQEVLESPIPKIAQNFIYDCQYLSKYGIYVNNVVHDTMWAMKFLHPEFEKGLDNVGRIYTRFAYWKDDGSDWNNISNWRAHLEYNCKDTTGTLQAYYNQQKALKARGLDTLFYQFVMRFAEPIREMCTRGLLVNPQALELLREKARREADNFTRIIDQICLERVGRTINPRSPKQLQAVLKEMGIKLPVKRSKTNGENKESADKKSLITLRRKHPREEILGALVGLSAKNKQLSSYLDFEYDRHDLHVRYTLDGCGTETGRFAGYNDPWGKGFNPQTVPKSTREIFQAEAGKSLLQIDLSQAESRYVAWEAPEPTLMRMLENREDIHRYVAGRIFNKPAEFVNNMERQLGKKSGHASNYGVGPRTFAESCLVEMNHYVTEKEAKHIINTYFEVFPGIRRRQQNIISQVTRTRMLRTPLGRERVFYERMGDGLFREAFAYAPQSTIPDITNHLMLAIEGHCELLLQVHDSLLIQVTPEQRKKVYEIARSMEWHPKIQLAGGDLIIPVDIEEGQTWGRMTKI